MPQGLPWEGFLLVSDPPRQDAIEIPDSDPLRLAFLEQSDLGNAERLRALAGGKLRWIEDLQLWAWYDGKRFDVERGGIAAQRLAHEVVRHIRLESAALYDLADRCESGEAEAHELLTRLRGPKYDHGKLKALAVGLLKHALKSGSAGMTAGMLRQSKSDLAALSEEFDRDPLVYNCRNGTIRFVCLPPGSPPHTNPADPGGRKWQVKFSPHDPSDMLMQLADVDYSPEAECPFWTERMARLHPATGPDSPAAGAAGWTEPLHALQLLYGSTLTGLTDDQAFYVFQGRGNDGKSATNRAIGEMHGSYFRHAGVKTFLQGADRGGAEHRSDLVRLRGDARFVTCDEPKERATWDGEVIKQVTGSLITARGSGERTEVTYVPRFKLLIECNNIPRPPSDDKGFRRRFKLFQWSVSLPAAGEDGHMSLAEVLDAMTAERSGILNWMIEGALQWLKGRHVPEPSAMQAVLKDYWAASSALLDWMDDRCDISDADALTYASELYADFKAFCEARGDEKVMTQTSFGTKLRDKHFSATKDAGGKIMRKGIRLLSEADRLDRFARDAEPASPARAASSGAASRSQLSGADDDEELAP